MSGLSCLFAPGECVDSVVGAWLAWFPYGLTGFTFVCGMLVGAALGKWGVAAVIALLVAIRSAPGETHEHVSGKDAAVPQREKLPKKKVRTIFDR
jgi:hypothetical protein